MWHNAFGISQVGTGTVIALSPGTIAALVVLVLWSLIWKGFALWRAVQERSKPWFIILLVVNTAGILEILYLYVFSKPKNGSTNVSATKV